MSTLTDVIETLTRVALNGSADLDARVEAVVSISRYLQKAEGESAAKALQQIAIDTDGQVRIAAIKALGQL